MRSEKLPADGKAHLHLTDDCVKTEITGFSKVCPTTGESLIVQIFANLQTGSLRVWHVLREYRIVNFLHENIWIIISTIITYITLK